MIDFHGEIFIINDDRPGKIFVHTPNSWRDLWKMTFAKLESEEWADEHVRVEAEVKVSCRVAVLIRA